MVIPGVHVDQPQVLRPRVVVPVAGEAVIRHARIGRRRRAEVAEGVVAGQGGGVQDARE